MHLCGVVVKAPGPIRPVPHSHTDEEWCVTVLHLRPTQQSGIKPPSEFKENPSMILVIKCCTAYAALTSSSTAFSVLCYSSGVQSGFSLSETLDGVLSWCTCK
jgi:hypothetical protein